MLVTLRSEELEVDITSFGATLTSVRVATAEGWRDVILGYESLAEYIDGKPNLAKKSLTPS